jgi:hypothetical protein
MLESRRVESRDWARAPTAATHRIAMARKWCGMGAANGRNHCADATYACCNYSFFRISSISSSLFMEL